MREILFRGKRKDNEEWAEGCLLNDSEQDESYIAECFEDRAAYIREVIPETVGQYTGLRDCKRTKEYPEGQPIFEGDIVKREYTLWHGEKKKTRETQIGVVFYSDTDCGFNLKNACNLRKPWDSDTLEVIGNVHDNPELLKGGAAE